MNRAQIDLPARTKPALFPGDALVDDDVAFRVQLRLADRPVHFDVTGGLDRESVVNVPGDEHRAEENDVPGAEVDVALDGVYGFDVDLAAGHHDLPVHVGDDRHLVVADMNVAPSGIGISRPFFAGGTFPVTVFPVIPRSAGTFRASRC